MGEATLLTSNADFDEMSAGEYRDIYEEVRQYDPDTGAYAVSLDKFVALVNSQYSKAQWSKYHSGETPLTRIMRNELRRCVDRPLLPATVADAVAGGTSPGAAVWTEEEGQAAHVVILVTSQEPQRIVVNGSVRFEEDGEEELPFAELPSAPKRIRKKTHRYTWTDDQEALRAELDVDPRQVIYAGLYAIRHDLELWQKLIGQGD